FSEEAFVAMLNADLANDLGNLASRATTMIVNFGGGAVPAPGPAAPEDMAVREGLATVLYTIGEALRGLGIVLDPFLPDAAAKIRGAVGAPVPSHADLGWGRLAPGTPVTKLSGLFPRID